MMTDTQVLHDVIAAFELHPELHFSRLYIDVKSRVVTIRGRVNSDAERRAAESIARGIVGMRALVLEVRVATAAKVRTVLETTVAASTLS